MKITSQIDAIKRHLKTKKSITSWEAIEKYGATRLSAIIYRLRNNDKWLIDTIDIAVKNRFGQKCNIAKYTLVKEGT